MVAAAVQEQHPRIIELPQSEAVKRTATYPTLFSLRPGESYSVHLQNISGKLTASKLDPDHISFNPYGALNIEIEANGAITFKAEKGAPLHNTTAVIIDSDGNKHEYHIVIGTLQELIAELAPYAHLLTRIGMMEKTVQRVGDKKQLITDKELVTISQLLAHFDSIITSRDIMTETESKRLMELLQYLPYIKPDEFIVRNIAALVEGSKKKTPETKPEAPKEVPIESPAKYGKEINGEIGAILDACLAHINEPTQFSQVFYELRRRQDFSFAEIVTALFRKKNIGISTTTHILENLNPADVTGEVATYLNFFNVAGMAGIDVGTLVHSDQPKVVTLLQRLYELNPALEPATPARFKKPKKGLPRQSFPYAPPVEQPVKPTSSEKKDLSVFINGGLLRMSGIV